MVGSTHAMVPRGYPVDIGGLVNARDFILASSGYGKSFKTSTSPKSPLPQYILVVNNDLF